MTMRNAFFALACGLVISGVGQAAVTGVGAVQVPQDVVPNTITNDIVIDFEADPLGLSFQQMILELSQGSVFQQATFGNNVPPNGALLPTFPDLAYDTFVSMGGAIAADSREILEVGGAVNIAPGAAKKFDTEGLNITWAPATGVVIGDATTDFITARISLSNDAVGTFRYIGASNSDDPSGWWQGEMAVMNGIIGGGGGGENMAPAAADADLGDIANAIITHTFTATDDGLPEPASLTWSNLTSTGGSPSVAATLGADGSFEWHTIGSARPGTYSWEATVSDGELTDVASLTLNLIVPEPATITLFGLAMVGLVGLGRRRLG